MNYIFVADKEEAKYIKKFPNTKIITVGIGTYSTIKTLSKLLQSGIFSKKDKFFNIGYCGTNYEFLNIGDVCEVSYSSVEEKDKITEKINKPICLKKGKINCYSSYKFVENTKHIGIFDMELYTLAIIFPNITSIKIVSDKLNFDEYKSINRNIKDSWDKANMLLAEKIKK